MLTCLWLNDLTFVWFAHWCCARKLASLWSFKRRPWWATPKCCGRVLHGQTAQVFHGKYIATIYMFGCLDVTGYRIGWSMELKWQIVVRWLKQRGIWGRIGSERTKGNGVYTSSLFKLCEWYGPDRFHGVAAAVSQL